MAVQPSTNNQKSKVLIPGLVSVTFRQLKPAAIVELASKAKLCAIEWGGDVHVPHGMIGRARTVGRLTRNAGLAVSAYGSYFRLGHSEQAGLTFESVLDTAEALGAPMVRVWAGAKNIEDASATYRKRIVSEGRRIARAAADRGIRVAFEFHRGTLTNTVESCRALVDDIGHPNLGTYWQPIHDLSPKENTAGIHRLGSRIWAVHVFAWSDSGRVRHPLRDGVTAWTTYFAALTRVGFSGCASLEFLKDNDPRRLAPDARTLRSLLRRADGPRRRRRASRS